ncbi:MAG: SRPBCC family protein [Pseudomonadales bacterium]|nr:SRPBCC family protein [Pseudomonadales bacterium]
MTKTKVEVIETVKAPAGAVWDILSDFAGIQIGGPITAVEVEGEGVGTIRRLSMGGGTVVERLDNHDQDKLTYTYSITNDDCPLPVAGYSATVTISSIDDASCSVNWTGTFTPKGADADTASKIINGIYTGGIQGARKKLNAA